MNNLKVIEVVTGTGKMSAIELVTAAELVKTAGDPIAVAPPVTDTVIHAAANTLQTLYNGTQTKPPTVLESTVQTQFNVVATMYRKNGSYLKIVANDAAIAAGDVNVGIAVVQRCGYKVKGDKAPTTKTFKGNSTVSNQVDVDTKSPGAGTIYVRQYGVTATKDVPPTGVAELLISKKGSISITNLKSGNIIAVREAYILSVPRKHKRGTRGTTGVIPSASGRNATTTASSTGNKIVFSDAAEHYNFGNWIYVVVK